MNTPIDQTMNTNSNSELREALGNGGFGQFVEDNAPVMFALIIIVVAAALIYEGVQFVHKRQELSAAEAFFPAQERYSKIKEGFDQAKMQGLVPPATPATKDKPAAVKATGDLQKDYGTVLPDLEKVANERAGTTAGAQAALILADTYLSYKEPEKAVNIAKLAAEKLSASNSLSPLARVLWGTALADKGDCQSAVGVWQQVLDNKNAAFLAADVSLRSGLCFEKMNQNDKAAEMYRKVSADSTQGQSSIAQSAKTYLRALDIKIAAAPNSPSATAPALNAPTEATKGGK